MSHQYNFGEDSTTDLPIRAEVTFWHDDELQILYVIVEGSIDENCLRSEMDFFDKFLKGNFMTGEFAVLCQLRKSAVLSPGAFLMVERFVTDTLNTRYLPTGVALVADPTVDEYLKILPLVKHHFDGCNTPFNCFYGFFEAENWLVKILQKKR